MITKGEIYEKVDKYLMMNVGNLVAPEEPVFDDEKRIWVIPIKYQSNFASFFLDSIVANIDGRFIYVPTREHLCEAVNERLENRITIKVELKPEKEKLEEVKRFIEKIKPETIIS